MTTPAELTLYNPEYRELAHNDCLLGAATEIAERVRLSK